MPKKEMHNRDMTVLLIYSDLMSCTTVQYILQYFLIYYTVVPNKILNVLV